MTMLLTDWITICTAGPTVDGRTIEEQWLLDAADCYDRDEYPAFVNCEHAYGNLGTVWELRTGLDHKGRLRLQARIRPNKYFLQQNAEGLRLCYSAEFIHNFAETGKTYLVALATTDSPASVGTTETHFARRNPGFRTDAVEGEPIQLTAAEEEKPPFSETVKKVFREIFTPKQQEKPEMTREEFSEAMKPYQEKLAELIGKIEALSQQRADNPAPAEAEAKVEPEIETADQTAVALEALAGKVEQLNAQIQKLAAEVPPKTSAINAGTGEADSEEII